MTNFDLGLILGASMPCWGSVVENKVATMYSYNGVVLPKLPEWDKEKYPYAYIYEASISTLPWSHILSIFNEPITLDADGSWSSDTATEYMSRLREETNTWEKFGTPVGGSAGISAPILWANTDILYEDGTLYLAASDPIPVYE